MELPCDGPTCSPVVMHTLPDHGTVLDEEEEAKRLAFVSPSQVSPTLFLGTSNHAHAHEMLDEKGIKYILCVHTSCRYPPARFVHKHIPICDYGQTNLQEVMEDAFDFIATAQASGAGCLVHCRSGVNRSPSILIAYFMARKRWTLRRSYDVVKAARPRISPHEQYFEQLRQLDVRLHGGHSVPDEDVPKSFQAYMRELRASLQNSVSDDDTSSEAATAESVSTDAVNTPPMHASTSSSNANSASSSRASTLSHKEVVSLLTLGGEGHARTYTQ